MNDASSLLATSVLDRLVGVIDLKDGQAVHAVAGHRDQYQRVRLADGDPLELARRYHALGVRHLYIADLDAISLIHVQTETLTRLITACHDFTETLIDIGWTGSEREISSLREADGPSIRWVVPTESAPSIKSLQAAASMVEPSRILLGLDYRHSRLVSRIDDEPAWVDAARNHGLGGAVILDLADVGTGSGGSTSPICRRVHQAAPQLTIYSGGGIQSGPNAERLFRSGCDYCLVATSLQSLMY